MIAQNLSSVVVIVLANAHGGTGALVLYNYGWQVFFVPYAVLAVPIATSAFPVLSAPPDRGRVRRPRSRQRRRLEPGRPARSVVARRRGCWRGRACRAARVFITHDPARARQLAWALAAVRGGPGRIRPGREPVPGAVAAGGPGSRRSP